MLNTTIGLKTAVCLTASVLLGASSYGAVIYDNTETFQGRSTVEPNGTELGDVVNFGGTDRILTDFQFEYFVGGAATGNETARIFLRAMDGPVIGGTTPLPGTILYDSGSFGIEAGYHTVNLSGLLLDLGANNSLAWTVSFGGVEAGDTAGLLFYLDSDAQGGSNPTFLDPVTGVQEHYTIRRGTDGGWELLNFPNVIDNLGARFTAIPEPGTWAILLGGLATLGFIRRRKA